jgi:WD40 repeat protein
LQFSRNGSRIAIANGESIVIYDVESCHALSSIRFSSTTRIRLAFSDDGDWLAAGGDDPGVYVFDSEAGTLLAVITNAYSEGLAFGADGTSLAVGEWEGKSFSSAVHIYETVQAPYRLPMARHDDQASFSRDGNLLVLYGKEDLPLRVVDVRARKIVSSVPITGSFETFHFGADDTVYALEYPVGALRTFDYRTGRERPSQNGHGYHDYVFRPESGDWAATDAQRLSVHVGRSKAMDIRLDGYGGHPLDLSRSGRFVTIGGAVFDVGQGQKTGQIAEANVFAVFIDPDDRFVISGSADGDVIVTDLASATRLYRYALGRDVFIVAVGLSQSRSEILIAYKHSFLGLGIYLRALPWADPVSIAASACTWTTRDLNDTERSSYLDHSRQTICAH